jgi:hypothetical protein
MQLSPATLDVLKNFATINQSAVFKAGSVQKTCTPQTTIIAQANLADAFPIDFAIYDLSQFLSVLSLVDIPVLDFGERAVTIKGTGSKVTYFYAAPENIVAPPTRKIALPSVDADFTLDAATLKSAMQAAGVLGLPEIYVAGRDGVTYIGAADSRSKTSNYFESEVGKTASDFHMIFKLENLKMMSRTYQVQLSLKGIAHFVAESKDIEYWLPVSTASTTKSA